MLAVLTFSALIVGEVASLAYRIKKRRERKRIMGRRWR